MALRKRKLVFALLLSGFILPVLSYAFSPHIILFVLSPTATVVLLLGIICYLRSDNSRSLKELPYKKLVFALLLSVCIISVLSYAFLPPIILSILSPTSTVVLLLGLICYLWSDNSLSIKELPYRKLVLALLLSVCSLTVLSYAFFLPIFLVLSPTATVVLLLGLICYLRRRTLKLRGVVIDASIESESRVHDIEAAGDFGGEVSNLQVFRLPNIEAATAKFSIENKLGEGGYGPVYKGVLPNGEEIAVKKLSKTSTQGFEEFKNEVILTAKLQHVNLVRVLGFCIERDEQMLIYEYMPNKSLDIYLFDLTRRRLLDWSKRVHIIEGITQGLLYLQEYSRFTIIHRDLKASNILLDKEMKPKISDFGMAKIFTKDEHEANTGRIVGTYGYVPPEYVTQGLYSTKSDVYSFGVLLLQIISGKKNVYCYGLNEDLNLLEYAYALWKSDKGMEFMDPYLDDTLSSCKLLRCLQIALLCVQKNAVDRPTMLEVSSTLKSESAALTIPKTPAFSRERNEDEENKSKLQLENCSVNDTTISQMVGR